MKQLFTRTLSVAAFVATAFATSTIAQPTKAPACDKPVPPPKELVVKDIEPGTGRPAKFRTAVLVGYTGYFYDGCKPDFKGEEFDSSKGRAAPLGFMIGAGRVIKGWEEGLIGMKEKDSTRVLIIPPDKAYGPEGRPPKIPANSTLVFEIYMHAFVHYPSDEEAKKLRLASRSFEDGGAIPVPLAFCAPDAKTHATLSQNRNPELTWSNAPAGTKSFVVICHDPDVPSKGDDVNKEGRVVPATLPRVDFFHWVLVDIPASVTSIAEGEFASSVTAKGKPGPAAAHGSRQGINDYTGWFAGDKDMAGNYYGYDGPCPPWNDAIVHHYVFTVFALDIERLVVDGAFTGPDVRKAVQGHVLAQAAITGLYSLNPLVKV